MFAIQPMSRFTTWFDDIFRNLPCTYGLFNVLEHDSVSPTVDVCGSYLVCLEWDGKMGL